MQGELIQSIELVFENCDTATIPFFCIKHFSLGEIQQQIYSTNAGTVRVNFVASNLFLRLSPEISQLTTCFGSNLLERIKKHLDITYVGLNTENKTVDYTIHWHKDDGFDSNRYQTVSTLESGEVLIEVSKE